MPTAKFCSECGATLRAPRRGFAPRGAHCIRCAPRFRAWQVLKVTSLLLLIAVTFGVGRYSTPPRTVYLIGSPIEPIEAAGPGAAPTTGAPSAAHEARTANAADEVVTICGAPTKSGKPCQRKVRGGGYCYQHRDKYGQKNSGARSQ